MKAKSVWRRLRREPPFADLFTFTVSGTEEGRVLRAAAGVREVLRRTFACADGQTEVLGPAPAPIVRVNNRFRYRCLLVGRNDKATREQVSRILKEFAGKPRQPRLASVCRLQHHGVMQKRGGHIHGIA